MYYYSPDPQRDEFNDPRDALEPLKGRILNSPADTDCDVYEGRMMDYCDQRARTEEDEREQQTVMDVD